MRRDLPAGPVHDKAASTNAAVPSASKPLTARDAHSGKLFRKYLLLIMSLVSVALLVSGGTSLYFSYQEVRSALGNLQHEKAIGAASRIEQYVRQTSQQLSYAALPQLDAGDVEVRRIEFLKLLRQAPEITDIAQLDAGGREQIAVSRLGMDVAASNRDRSQDPAFTNAKRGQPWYGPVYFRKETEPYMTMAIRSGGEKGPVTVAEVNLKFIWDVVSRIKIGDKGKAYVIDANGLLIADPDIGLVLRKTSLAALPHVKAAAQVHGANEPAMVSKDLAGTSVLTAAAPIELLAWKVFVEQPIAEVYARLDAAIVRTAALLLAGLVISALAASALARSMVRPIRTLDEGARRIGAGELDQTIVIKTGDELEGLADQFNRMTAQLRESYAGLERKVEQRTRELTESLDYQTAISGVLRVISESPTDVAPVFEAIMESARRLFGTSIAAVFRYDGQNVHMGTTRGWSAQSLEDARRIYPGPPNPAMLSGRVILSGQVQTIVDTHTDPAYDQTTAQVGEWRRMIGAPMLKDGAPVGVIVVAWPEPGETPQRQADLLRTFADQAVIAIENVRLINETKEALERQTATAEVLQVISNSVADTQPVFERILESTERLIDCTETAILLAPGDGQLHLGAYHGRHPYGTTTRFPRPLDQTAAPMVIAQRRQVYYPDVIDGPGVPPSLREAGRRGGNFSIVLTPMFWKSEGIGMISVRREPNAVFNDKELGLLRTFSDQAAIAIQNARLFNETKEALEQQTATAEILQVISSSPTDVQPVFDAIAERARTLCGARIGSVARFDGERVHLVAFHGGSAEGSDAMRAAFPMPPGRGSVHARAAFEGAPIHIADVLADPDYALKDAASRAGLRSNLAVPMLRDGQVIGSIGVGREEPGLFSAKLVRLLQTFADQAVIAV